MALIITVLGSLPYAYGYASAPEGQRFMGFVGRGTPAANAYLMFARQAREGDPSMHNQYQPVPPDRYYLNLEWWAFGMLAPITGGSLIAIFHLGRVLSVFAYCLALYYFLGVLLRADQQRRYAFFFILFGTGFGWLVLLGRKLGLIDWALRRQSPDASIPTAASIYGYHPSVLFSFVAFGAQAKRLTLRHIMFEPYQPFADVRRRAGVGKPNRLRAAYRVEIQPRRDRYTGAGQNFGTERAAVISQVGHIRVNVKRPVRRCKIREPSRAQTVNH